MAKHTDLYRRRRLWLAFVEIQPDGTHLPVNAPDGFKPLPTKETWHHPELECPIEPGGIYAAIQEFFDVQRNENPYHVLRLVRLPDDRALAEAQDRNHYFHASRCPLPAKKDKHFWMLCLDVGLIDEEEYAELIKPPLEIKTTPHKKSTLRF